MPPSTPLAKRRRRWLAAATGLFLLCLAVAAAWWFTQGQRYAQTDNAYVHGDLVQVTSPVPGTVIAINADDTDRAIRGATLVQLDPADTAIALEAASARLAQTVRQARSRYAALDTLGADVRAREAWARKVAAELDLARDNLTRRRALVRGGGISGEELLHADTAFRAAEAQWAEAEAAIAAARAHERTQRALTDGTTVATHPDVRAAIAQLHEAWLAHQRLAIPAPIAGNIARRSVQLGQRVAPGTVLMSIVPLDQVWVEANFKEHQLRRMRIGQPATVTSDLYGSSVVYRGRISGIDAGTGSAFALLPAQNATGNWIKIVQRIPVRIAIEPEQLLTHPLRIGMSMSVRVDLQATDLAPPSAGTAARDDFRATSVFLPDTSAFDALVRDILNEHDRP